MSGYATVKSLAAGFMGAAGQFLASAAGAFLSLNLVFACVSLLPRASSNWLMQEGIGPLPWSAVLWLTAASAGAILGIVGVRVALRRTAQ